MKTVPHVPHPGTLNVHVIIVIVAGFGRFQHAWLGATRCSWICHDSTKTQKLCALREGYPPFKMRVVTGPLKSGTYIRQAVTDCEFATISKDQLKFALTKSPESEATKVRLIALENSN